MKMMGKMPGKMMGKMSGSANAESLEESGSNEGQNHGIKTMGKVMTSVGLDRSGYNGSSKQERDGMMRGSTRNIAHSLGGATPKMTGNT